MSLPHRSSEILISASSQEGECLTWLLAALISCAGLYQSLQKASHFKWALLHFKCVFLEQCPAFICIVINPADLLRLGAAFQNPDSKYPSQNLVIFHYLVLSSVQPLSGTTAQDLSNGIPCAVLTQTTFPQAVCATEFWASARGDRKQPHSLGIKTHT